MIAWHERRHVHALRSLIEHRALTTHNDGLRHWRGDHGTPSENVGSRFRKAVQEFEGAGLKYIDVHAWYFTPDSEAASVFEGGGAGSEDTASAAQVDLLYRQIGQLKVENDFLSRKLGK